MGGRWQVALGVDRAWLGGVGSDERGGAVDGWVRRVWEASFGAPIP